MSSPRTPERGTAFIWRNHCKTPSTRSRVSAKSKILFYVLTIDCINVIESANVRLCVEGLFFENEVMWIKKKIINGVGEIFGPSKQQSALMLGKFTTTSQTPKTHAAYDWEYKR